MKHLYYKSFFVFCFLLTASLSFAASEAEYKRLSKSWKLNADGSQEFSYAMELTLFTHTAMNSTYGESFIVYDPSYQTLKINESYTKQKDGTIIKTPDNAFVEVLPSKAANAPAYNGLKEMVVVHTGLELGATIFLDYTITTKAGYLPALDIYECVAQTSPVKAYNISVTIPESGSLTYKLSNRQEQPEITTANGQKTFTWELSNINALSRWKDDYRLDNPILTAHSYASSEDMAKTISRQMQNPASTPLLKTLAETVTEGATTDIDKVKAVYQYIQESYRLIPLALPVCGYRLRPLEDVINSAYGTDAELLNVFQGLLKVLGIKTNVYAALSTVDALGAGLHNAQLYLTAEAGGNTLVLATSKELTQKALMARQYFPSLDLASCEVIAPAMLQTPVVFKANISVGNGKASAKVESSVPNYFLDLGGASSKAITARDKDAQVNCNATSASFSYAQEILPEIAGEYEIYRLPDYEFSAANSCDYVSGSKRDILLTLPVLYDESYTYSIDLGDKELCTPTADKTVKNNVGSAEIRISKNGNNATVVRNLKLSKSQITPDEYPAYLDLMKTWADANYTQLLVK